MADYQKEQYANKIHTPAKKSFARKSKHKSPNKPSYQKAQLSMKEVLHFDHDLMAGKVVE